MAAALLVALGINGTLSAWSTAILTNDTNTVAVANAVILKETDGTNTCNSTDAGTTNSATCSTINKYGGTAVPLGPGGTQTVTVTMTNTGSGPGTLTFVAGACTASGGQSATNSVCGQMQVKVECPAGTATYPANRDGDAQCVCRGAGHDGRGLPRRRGERQLQVHGDAAVGDVAGVRRADRRPTHHLDARRLARPRPSSCARCRVPPCRPRVTSPRRSAC